MIIDEKRIFEIINERKPHSVALNGPEALVPKIQNSASNITEKFGIPAYIIGDTCWGSCDLNTHAANMLGAEILFNIGHTISMEIFDEKVVMINAFDDIIFDRVARKCALELKSKNYNSISLVTDSQHLNQITRVKEVFEELGKKVQLIALTDITEDRIQIFKGIDAFVQVACPRISIDNHFKKPMLSVPQALALIKLLKKEPIDNFLKIRHWL